MKHIIYISTPENQKLQVLKINRNDELEIIQTINTNGESQPIVSLNNRLYVGMRPNFHIAIYNIQSTGKLEKIGESPIPGSPNYLSIDRTNRFLFCASYGNSLLSVSKINRLGIPESPLQILYNIEGCHYCKMDFYNKILFVTALKKNCIYLYNLTNTGKLKKNNHHILQTEIGIGPRHMALHANKKYAYSINELNSTIDVWHLINNNKKIELIQNISILPKSFNGIPWASDIHIHPFGSYLYACDRKASIITLLKIQSPSNKLYIMKHIITEKQPRSFYISNDGKYLVVAGELSNSITLYLISNDALFVRKKHEIFIGHRPIWVHINTLQ